MTYKEFKRNYIEQYKSRNHFELQQCSFREQPGIIVTHEIKFKERLKDKVIQCTKQELEEFRNLILNTRDTRWTILKGEWTVL